MRKYLLHYVAFILTTSLIASCNKMEESENIVNPDKDAATLIANIVEPTSGDINTRTSISNGFKFTWTEGDILGIYPDEGDQIYFKITDGIGSNTATFDGGGWALKKGYKYYSYYPFNRSNFSSEDTKEAIPVSIEEQSIDGNDMFGHLGKCDPMFAQSENSTGSIAWDFQHLVSWLKLNVTLAADCNVSEIILYNEEALLHTKGTFDLTADKPAIVSTNNLKEISIPCTDLAIKANRQTVIPIAIIPTDLNGKNLKIKLVTNIGVYIFDLPIAKEWRQGYYYSQTLTNDTSTQNMLNDRLLVNQLFTVNYNVESISWDTETDEFPWEADNLVTFCSDYDNQEVKIQSNECNSKYFFNYSALTEKANVYKKYNYVPYLLFNDGQGNYYRIPLAGEVALLIPFADYIDDVTSNRPVFDASVFMESSFSEKLQTKAAKYSNYVPEETETLITGLSKMIRGTVSKKVNYIDIGGSASTLVTYPVFALRLKGSDQYAAYKYELKNIEDDFVLSIKIKGLDPDDNVTTLEDISADSYWSASYVEHIIPASGIFYDKYWLRANTFGYFLSANMCQDDAIWIGGFDYEGCYTTNGHTSSTYAYPLRLVKTTQDWWESN